MEVSLVQWYIFRRTSLFKIEVLHGAGTTWINSHVKVGRAMDMLRLYARTLKVVEPIAEAWQSCGCERGRQANQHKAFVELVNRVMKDSVFQQVFLNTEISVHDPNDADDVQ
eukprot:113027-Amphidinium_carterae.1